MLKSRLKNIYFSIGRSCPEAWSWFRSREVVRRQMHTKVTPKCVHWQTVCRVKTLFANTPIPHKPRIPRIDTNWQIFGFVAESYSVRDGLN